MKRVLTLLAAVGLVAAACGGAGSGAGTTAPVVAATATAQPSPANTFVFTADLSPAFPSLLREYRRDRGNFGGRPPSRARGRQKGTRAAGHHFAIAGVSGRNPGPALPKL